MNDPRFFFCRLVPPRPDFASTMSADERRVMLEHVRYWTDQLQQGIAIAFGPVADPSGDWGAAIVRSPHIGAMEGMRDADPVILSGRGFRYEILPFVKLATAPTLHGNDGA